MVSFPTSDNLLPKYSFSLPQINNHLSGQFIGIPCLDFFPQQILNNVWGQIFQKKKKKCTRVLFFDRSITILYKSLSKNFTTKKEHIQVSEIKLRLTRMLQCTPKKEHIQVRDIKLCLTRMLNC